MGYPRVSETFIASELLRVERAGVPLRLFVVKPVEERERELRHPVVDAIRAPAGAPARRRRRSPRPLHRWRPPTPAPFMPALARVARRRPRRPRRAPPPPRSRQAIRDRRTPLSGPRKIYVKELLQAIALADRVLDAPDVRHLHAHFAHGTTTITWHAARDRRAAVLVHRPRARHLRRAPEPQGLAAAQAARRPLRRHLHRGQRPPPARRSRPRRTSTSSTTASTPTSRACSPSRSPRPPRTARCACSRVGRLVAKKGFDVLVDACAVLRRRGVAFEAAIVGQEDKHSAAVRERIAGHGLEDRVLLPGPDGPGRAAARVPPRERAVHAQPPARRRPRRDPERPRRGDGGRHAGDRERGLRHPRARRARGQRPARRARGPGGARRHAAATARRPGARARARAQRARDGRAPLRRRRSWRPGSPSCSRRRSGRDRRHRTPSPPGAVHDRARAPQPRDRRRRPPPDASRSRARRACWAPTRTGAARTSPPTRSGGSSGSSSAGGSISPTPGHQRGAGRS